MTLLHHRSPRAPLFATRLSLRIAMLAALGLSLCTACCHPDKTQNPNPKAANSNASSSVQPPQVNTRPSRVEPPPAPTRNEPPPIPDLLQQRGHLYAGGPAVRDLVRVLRKPRTGEDPLVVVQYGDSHTRAATIASTMRDAIAKGRPISPGYTSIGHPFRWESSVQKNGPWIRHNWLYGRDTPSFGPMGLAYSVQHRDLARKQVGHLTLSLKETPPSGIQVNVYYLREADQLPFRLSSGGKTLAEIPAAAAGTQPELGVARVTLPDGASSLDLVVPRCPTCSKTAEFRFFGFRTEYPSAEVTWDALGIGGTTIRSPVNRSDGTMNAYLDMRQPDLFVTWYGSNSSVEKHLNLAEYRTRFTSLIKRLRERAPDAACLVLGPPDLNRTPEKACLLTRDERKILDKKRKSKRDRKALRANRSLRVCNPDALIGSTRRGRYPVPEARNRAQWEQYKRSCGYRTIPNIPALTQLQREVALEQGCAFFDVYNFMGGPQSIQRWACSEPQLASMDLVHLTRDGYTKVGSAVAATLDDLITQPVPGAPPLEDAPTTPSTNLTPETTTAPTKAPASTSDGPRLRRISPPRYDDRP